MNDTDKAQDDFDALVDTEHEIVMARAEERLRVERRRTSGFMPAATIPIFRDSDDKVRAEMTEHVLNSAERVLDVSGAIDFYAFQHGLRGWQGGLHPDFVRAILEHRVETGHLVRLSQGDWYERSPETTRG